MAAPFEPPQILQAPAPDDHPAIAYARRGWHVLPLHDVTSGRCSCGLQDCKSPGKHPRTATGVKEASADPAQIQQWLAAWPTMNIGIATGPSGLYVLDEDPKHGGDAALLDLIKRHGDGIMASPRVRTGGGGGHVYYDRRGLDLHNTAGALGPGLDTRGVGGYVVAPPSLHASGRRYEWATGASPNEVPLLEVPAKLVADLQRPRGAAAPVPETIVTGGRNHHLTSMAGSMQRRGMTREAILAALQIENATRCKPPLAARELDQVVRSVTSYPKGPVPDAIVDAGETDVGNAQRFAALHGTIVRYVTEWGFLVWDGRRWRRNRDVVMRALAEKTSDAVKAAAAQVQDDDRRKALLKWGKTSSNLNRLESMIKLAASQPGIEAFVEEFDAHDDLLNVRNGVIDLTTGELRPHDPNLYLTGFVDIDYDPDAACERWLQFVRDCCLGDMELVAYLQRAAGYTLTGHTKEHVLFFLFGDGRNGKSTFVKLIGELLGELATPTGFETFLASRDAKTQNALAPLVGKRMVVATEAPEGRSFNEEAIKQATGGDRLRAEFKYKDSFEFTPKFKIWLAANDKPHIRGVNEGIWERLHLVPFQNHVLKHKRDKDLERRLRAELPGILAWAVRGAKDWYTSGLQPPAKVLEAVEDYRQDNDVVGRWIEECCTVHEDLATPAGELHANCNAWLASIHEKEMTQTAFGRRLAKYRAQLLKRDKDTKTGRVVWLGIAVGKNIQPANTQVRLGQAAAPAPLAAQQDRIDFVSGTIADLARKSNGFCHHADVAAAYAETGADPSGLKWALDELQRTGKILVRGDGRYAPVRA